MKPPHPRRAIRQRHACRPGYRDSPFRVNCHGNLFRHGYPANPHIEFRMPEGRNSYPRPGDIRPADDGSQATCVLTIDSGRNGSSPWRSSSCQRPVSERLRPASHPTSPCGRPVPAGAGSSRLRVSWPQCLRGRWIQPGPGTTPVQIIGLTRGRPFAVGPCRPSRWTRPGPGTFRPRVHHSPTRLPPSCGDRDRGPGARRPRPPGCGTAGTPSDVAPCTPWRRWGSATDGLVDVEHLTGSRGPGTPRGREPAGAAGDDAGFADAGSLRPVLLPGLGRSPTGNRWRTGGATAGQSSAKA